MCVCVCANTEAVFVSPDQSATHGPDELTLACGCSSMVLHRRSQTHPHTGGEDNLRWLQSHKCQSRCLSERVCVCVCCWWPVRLSCQLAGSRWRLMEHTNNKKLAMIINMLMAISNTHSDMPTSVCVWRVCVILHRLPSEKKLQQI